VRTVGLLAVLMATWTLAAQNGSAPPGYYPDFYRGSSFRGVVDSNSEGRLTLKYAGKKKTETFTAPLETSCSAEGKNGIRTFKEADIPVGSELIALYHPKKVEKDGKKETENQIIGIAFTKMEGEAIPDDKLMIIWCTNARHLTFRYW
jgi:hypothetical protein